MGHICKLKIRQNKQSIQHWAKTKMAKQRKGEMKETDGFFIHTTGTRKQSTYIQGKHIICTLINLRNG